MYYTNPLAIDSWTSCHIWALTNPCCLTFWHSSSKVHPRLQNKKRKKEGTSWAAPLFEKLCELHSRTRVYLVLSYFHGVICYNAHNVVVAASTDLEVLVQLLDRRCRQWPAVTVLPHLWLSDDFSHSSPFFKECRFAHRTQWSFVTEVSETHLSLIPKLPYVLIENVSRAAKSLQEGDESWLQLSANKIAQDRWWHGITKFHGIPWFAIWRVYVVSQ